MFRLLATAQSAGFSVATFRWYQYAFTEARAIFTYIRLALFPLGQSIDQDYPTSHTVTEHGALFYVVLLAALLVAAILWRRRWPLACFGLLFFLICLAPTSSIVPVDDALVERRMYLPLIGLILIGCEMGSRLRISRLTAACTLAIVCLILGKLCYDRNRLWGEPDKLLELAASGAVYNPAAAAEFHGDPDSAQPLRPGACLPGTGGAQAAPKLLRQRRMGPDAGMPGAFRPGNGQRPQTAARLQPCSQIYEWIGLVYGQMGQLENAGLALKRAVQLGPYSESAHGSRRYVVREDEQSGGGEAGVSHRVLAGPRGLMGQARVHSRTGDGKLVRRGSQPLRQELSYISRRPSMAFDMVTSSANSRSLPTGIPMAMRVTFTPSGLSRLRQVDRRGFAFDRGVGGHDHFLDLALPDALHQALDLELLRPDAAQRRERAVQHVIAAVELARGLDAHDVVRLLHHADHCPDRGWDRGSTGTVRCR